MADQDTTETFTYQSETMSDDGSWTLYEAGSKGTRRVTSKLWGDAVEVRLLRKNTAGLWGRV